jgi:broad specificity phosphatase PhoE
MRLILARHGQSWANVDSTKHSDPDSPLTPLGEQQADRLGRWLKQHEPELDVIWASPLQRARNTAAIANQYLNLPVVLHDGLMEIPRYDLPMLDQREHPFLPETQSTPPQPEDNILVHHRVQVKLVLDELITDLYRPKPILVISHGGTCAAMLRIIFNRTDIYFRTHNTAFHDVEWRDGRWMIFGLNLKPHLPAELIT